MIILGAVYELWSLHPQTGQPIKEAIPAAVSFVQERDVNEEVRVRRALSSTEFRVMRSQLGEKLADSENEWFAPLRYKLMGDAIAEETYNVWAPYHVFVLPAEGSVSDYRGTFAQRSEAFAHAQGITTSPWTVYATAPDGSLRLADAHIGPTPGPGVAAAATSAAPVMQPIEVVRAWVEHFAEEESDYPTPFYDGVRQLLAEHELAVYRRAHPTPTGDDYEVFTAHDGQPAIRFKQR